MSAGSLAQVAKASILYGGRKARLPLDIVIVGCGIGGLATAFCLGEAGHKVTVLESSPVIGEVGAGIQITPNVTRLLIRWGLGPELDKVVVAPQAFTFRRYENGEVIGRTVWGDNIRADYHNLLFQLAKPWMRLRLNSRVVSVNASIPALTLESGEIIQADLVIGADGIKSMLREVVVGCPDRPRATGDAAYRAIIPTSEMIKDPVLKHLVDETEMTGWMGPQKHIMAYCIRAKKEYNIVMAHPDDGSVESYTAEASTEKMRRDFEGWEPRVRKLLALVRSTLDWKLMDRAPLSTWVHKDGRIALLGDACHPMLPYRAQGAAMSIEDAITMGVIFSHISDLSQITPMLHAYQDLRYTRTTASQLEARMNQKTFHFEDGPEQQMRDASMRAAMNANELEAKNAGNANMWADKARNAAQFGYDAEEVANRWWEETGRSTIGNIAAMKSRL